MSDSKKFTLIGATGAILSIVVLFIALFMQPTKWSKSAEKNTTQSTVEQEYTPETYTASPQQDVFVEDENTEIEDFSSDNASTNKSSDESAKPQKFNGDRRYSIGTYCRKDGKCVYITGNDENQAMTLDVSELGADNPLPAKQDTIPLAFYMQGPVDANTMNDQFNMLTSYTFTIDCTDLQNCVDGEIRRPDFSTNPFQNIGSAMEFVEPPVYIITKVMSTNTTQVMGEDASHPPQGGSNYIYFWESYGRQYASDDSVFYEQ